MASRYLDWLKQAERDLEQARDSQGSSRYEWACFAAHQSGEKAVKALHLYLGQEAWGYVLARLLQELPSQVKLPGEMVEKGQALDTYYIPTRYPNAHAEGAPFERYGSMQSQEAISYASEIIAFVGDEMARLKGSG